MGLFILRIKWRLGCNFRFLFLKLLFGKRIIIGKESFTHGHFHVYLGKGATIEIGRHVFFNNGSSLNVLERLQIGDDTIFGENVKIYDQNHGFGDPNELIRKQEYKTAPVIIGKNCWIGSNTVILKGVTIGDNCVIGAGCVISQDIPSNSIVTQDRHLIIKEKRR